jgi:GDP-L-fucose synthase
VNGQYPSAAFWSGRTVALTGGEGFLGRHVCAALEEVNADVRVVRSAEHDLRDPGDCRAALAGASVAIHLAARVGGIGFNRSQPAPLARDNLLLGINVFDAARDAGVEKLVASCSVCAYPLDTPVPFSELDIWDGYPEDSNAPYGLAKRMLLVLSDAYRRQYSLDSCAPVFANLYGPGDNFDLASSHVVAAMVRKYVEAAERGEDQVVLWGTGTPTREFLFVEDAARALLLCAERWSSSEPINIGTGEETSISDLAEMIAMLTGYEGETIWDPSRPDGQPRRSLDVSRAKEHIGFSPLVSLEEGLSRTVSDFRSQRASSAGQRHHVQSRRPR